MGLQLTQKRAKNSPLEKSRSQDDMRTSSSGLGMLVVGQQVEELCRCLQRFPCFSIKTRMLSADG